ncbi:MAG: hypothetical protein RLZZ416_262 [Candidatus Parcubacteria bacterium]|jgi:prepilin-type N-terminal cleavage/methylation domain-containing protein
MTRHLKNRPSRIRPDGEGKKTTFFKYAENAGFTLIETLVAISLLTVAIVAPMSLTAQSLASAYYARDQITAFYMAQEAIEALRSIRDSQILTIALTANASSVSIFGPLEDRGLIGTSLASARPFTVDAHTGDSSTSIAECPQSACPPLQTDGTLYGYGTGWTNTNFTRMVRAAYVDSGHNEIRVSVTITWRTGAFEIKNFTISENLYRWVNDGAGTSS